MILLKSLLLGIAIAAPLGPIGLLCINRTLQRGFWAGFAGGVGTAVADGVYAALAALGFATFAGVLAMIDTPLRLVGGAFMVWLGWKSLSSTPTRSVAQVSASGIIATAVATFLLTIVNPMTILSFTAIFGGLGLASEATPSSFLLVVLGVFSGSMLWWSVLSGGVALTRTRLPERAVGSVSRVCGFFLIGFGLWACGSAVF